MYKNLIFALTLLLPSPSLSDETVYGFNKWACLAGEKTLLDNIEISDGGARVNNIVLRESSDFISGAPALVLEANIANRSDRRISISIEVIGLKGTDVRYAISANTPFDWVAPGRNGELRSAIIRVGNMVAEADHICIRVSGVRASK